MRSHYSVTGNSSIPLKYHHFSTQSPTTLISLSHLSISSKILSQQTSGSSICNCSGPLLLPHYVELVISQVWFWWPQHMTPVVYHPVPKETTAITRVRHVPCGVALSRWRIASHDRCPGLFLQTASRSDHIRSHMAFTLTAVPQGMIFNVDDSFASKKTDAITFPADWKT